MSDSDTDGALAGALGPASGAADDHAIGSACWIDLGVTDPASVAAFYTEVFGWDVAAADESGYRLASRQGHLVAGLGPAEDPGPPYWTVYLHTADAPATVAAILTGGGSLVADPAPVGDAGIAATVRDHNGATFALWQPLGQDGTWTAAESGTLAGFQLLIDDLASARQFWDTAIGWQLEGNGAIRANDRTVGTWRRAPIGQPQASPWLIQLRTNDPTTARQRAIKLGATIPDGNHEVLCDPAGARFSMVT